MPGAPHNRNVIAAGTARMTVLVKIEGADLFLFYDEAETATLNYQLADPRARIINPKNAKPTWQSHPIPLDDAWSIRGQGVFSLGAVHFWRNGIDFDYLDVGANVGMTAIAQALFFARCGHHNHTYALEPGPVFDLLERSVRINGMQDRLTCIRAAAGARNGKARFYVTPGKLASCSLSQQAVNRPGIDDRFEIEVEVVALDQIHIRRAPGLLVKIDAEGCDFQVLDGMRQTAEERLTLFQIEVFPSIMTDRDLPAELSALNERYVLVDVPTRCEINSARVTDYIAEVATRLPIAASDVYAIDRRVPNVGTLVSRALE
jgi:FkbM family methyltransferase